MVGSFTRIHELLMILCLLATLCVDAAVAVTPAVNKFAYQDVRVELFLEDNDDGTLPCESTENYTLVFKNMKLDNGKCITNMFPRPSTPDGQKWMQFSAKALVRPDAGLQIWLYFTRDEISGAVTYCAEENIQNLPYPLEVSPSQDGACQIISLPNFQLDGNDGAEEQRSMAMRVTYDVTTASKLVATMQALIDSSAVSLNSPLSLVGFIICGLMLSFV